MRNNFYIIFFILATERAKGSYVYSGVISPELLMATRAGISRWYNQPGKAGEESINPENIANP
jgi:hypothetical protein